MISQQKHCSIENMAGIRDFIDSKGFVVLDGGLATELENRGESLNNPLWSARILMSAAEKIADVHHSYFTAGADVAITASYQATFPGLRAAGLNTRQAEEVIRRSVSVAIEAHANVFGAMRKTGWTDCIPWWPGRSALMARSYTMAPSTGVIMVLGTMCSKSFTATA